ncbi:peptide MFS transporter [Actinoplanes sp. NPDC049316]|uniref:peptide MFS transporter n=1 Tax=Actinoplanes sp. NPDC049316 TaxID=3154727 RepID=UPI0034408540
MTAVGAADPGVADAADQVRSVWSFFRDPRFSTLFVVDLWERFSFYGMQALLFLYAAAPVADGGLGLGAGTAGALFGLYMASVFIAGLPGGWVGDRILGTRRALLYGCYFIAAGHYVLAVPARGTFYLGLLLIAVGTGLVKPNLPVLFTVLYPRATSALREAAFAVFYMGVQVSALLAPLVTGLLGERVNWHLGFGAAAVGMTIGVLRLVAGLRRFGPEGLEPPNPAGPATRRRALRRTALIVAVAALVYGADAAAGTFAVEHLLAPLGLVALTAPFLYYRHLMRRPEFGAGDRARIRAYRWVLVPSSLFWLLFSQLGSSFVLFAREHTDRGVGSWLVPASWFQSLHPLFLLLVAPLSAWLWVRLGSRAGAPVKLAAGLLTSAAGFAVVAVAAVLAGSGVVSPLWLVLAFLCQACGEVTFGPVGLSVTAEMAPRGYESRLIGLYYLGAACGAGLGGQLSRLVEVLPGPVYFALFSVAAFAVGAVLAGRSARVDRRLRIGRTRVHPSSIAS